MLIDFLFELRARKLPVSTHEWMALMEAMALGLHESSLDGFYHLCRTLCVKDIALYDAYDEAFLAYFKDVHTDALELTKQLQDWLANPRALEGLTQEQRDALKALDLERLRELFEQRLREQKERHDGGNRWIGTGGTSPFGTGGNNPTGMRLGGGGGRSAMAVADERRFKEYRRDVVLDVRQIDVALRGLRKLGREGAHEELDLDETIDETCRNAGELEIVFRPPRRNRVKVLLLMDVGGSMDPHSELMSRLFTAASRNGRFAKFRSYYFHNCVYNSVYEDALFRKGVTTADLLATSDRDEKLVVVGDALMHPAELMDPGGSMYLYNQNRASGIEWLRRLAHHFRSAAWLNPEPDRYWAGTTIEVIASVFPMYALTLDGLAQAVRYLVRGGEKPKVGDPSRWMKAMAR
ncbi:MAG: VWA domain-containing protein [Deltaproteobacteria bacterium]|nr:VWA domain-containing protein [Deltaproteobacteria bacterium]